MTSGQHKTTAPRRVPARPVFVVGSPRSGTSILTWCLGQHPNILPLEEGNWLDKLAYDLGSTFERGTRRGDRSQLSALGIGFDEVYACFGLAVNELILGSRSRYYEQSRQAAIVDPGLAHPSIQLSREPGEPKLRWVDGTPEYSFCIYGLLKLFPDARFIHIVRDVSSVVRSLVKFSVDGRRVSPTERAAYEYWMGTTRACLRAERAFGPGRICRIQYDDMVENPVGIFTSLSSFLGETFSPSCLEPLQRKINSSHVPAGFDCQDGTTPAALAEEARTLSDEIRNGPAPISADESELALLERDFLGRVQYFGDLDTEFEKTILNLRSVEQQLADRTEWARRLDAVIAERDLTIRQYQHELEKRTLRNMIWALAQRVCQMMRLRKPVP
jgi:hypothetical protein